LQGLRGIRIAVCTELDETDEFAEGNLKRLTGEATITSRALYSDYVTFATTQLVSIVSASFSSKTEKQFERKRVKSSRNGSLLNDILASRFFALLTMAPFEPACQIEMSIDAGYKLLNRYKSSVICRGTSSILKERYIFHFNLSSPADKF
jgi:hypothetical protein